MDPLQLLVTLGADLSLKDENYGNTAAHWAAVQGNHTGLSVLVRHNAPVGRRNNEVIRIIIVVLSLGGRGLGGPP